MSTVAVTESSLENIASAIRAKNGQSTTYTPSQMASAIMSIKSAAELSIISQMFSQNGTYSPSSFSADAFADVVVDIANTYTASDEGKVVSGASLVGQTSLLASVNSTYDTTRNNQVVVSVPNSYSASDEGKVVYSGTLTPQVSSTISANGVYDTTLINQLYAEISGSGGGSGVVVPTHNSGLAYGYIATNGGFYGGSVNNYRLDAFYLHSGHNYLVGLPSNTHKNRGRVNFYSNKTYADFAQYINNPNENISFYTGTVLLSSDTAIDNIVRYTPSISGMLFAVTNNQGYSDTQAYCFDFDAFEYTLASLNVLSNGTYDPSDSNADSFSNVVVNVQSGEGLPMNIIDGSGGSIFNSTLSRIRTSGFAYYSNLYSVQFDNVEYVNAFAFYYCSGLSIAILPKCKQIEKLAFNNCYSLLSVSIPSCEYIGSSAFAQCSALNNINAENVRTIGVGVFESCISMTSISFPKCTIIYDSTFGHMSYLDTVSLPLLEKMIGVMHFRNDINLKTISLPKCISIGYNAFYGCSRLKSVYLLNSNICSLSGKTAFSMTPIVSSSYIGEYGSIFVPLSLVDAYKSAQNWSDISDRITAYVEE